MHLSVTREKANLRDSFCHLGTINIEREPNEAQIHEKWLDCPTRNAKYAYEYIVIYAGCGGSAVKPFVCCTGNTAKLSIIELLYIQPTAPRGRHADSQWDGVVPRWCPVQCEGSVNHNSQAAGTVNEVKP